MHRPYQVTTAQEVDVLRTIGRRLVITQLDNIALRNPGYFSDYSQWSAYRRLHYAVLAAADQVVFISRHGADDARELSLVPEERINVVPPAVDHPLGLEIAPAAPARHGAGRRSTLPTVPGYATSDTRTACSRSGS